MASIVYLALERLTVPHGGPTSAACRDAADWSLGRADDSKLDLQVAHAHPHDMLTVASEFLDGLLERRRPLLLGSRHG